MAEAAVVVAAAPTTAAADAMAAAAAAAAAATAAVAAAGADGKRIQKKVLGSQTKKLLAAKILIKNKRYLPQAVETLCFRVFRYTTRTCCTFFDQNFESSPGPWGDGPLGTQGAPGSPALGPWALGPK